MSILCNLKSNNVVKTQIYHIKFKHKCNNVHDMYNFYRGGGDQKKIFKYVKSNLNC